MERVPVCRVQNTCRGFTKKSSPSSSGTYKNIEGGGRLGGVRLETVRHGRPFRVKPEAKRWYEKCKNWSEAPRKAGKTGKNRGKTERCTSSTSRFARGRVERDERRG